jgi:Cu-Zn family superoxide dismutase
MRFATVSGLFCCVVLCACWEEEIPGLEEQDTERLVATATIVPKSGNTELVGTALFTELAGEIALTLEIDGAPPGKHGVHIHQVGDCSAADATSAGAHWNPEGHTHGMPETSSHLGDLGNMIVREDGKGAITIRKPEWTAGDGSAHDVIGKAIVFHANIDDFSDPAGNSGSRIGCGVIEPAPQ